MFCQDSPNSAMWDIDILFRDWPYPCCQNSPSEHIKFRLPVTTKGVTVCDDL